MKTSHTPGPWEIDTQGRFQSITAHGCDICAMPDQDGQKPTPTEQANARLIAAAPELLEIARRALEYAPNEIEANKCRAAIAKATRSPSGDTHP